MGAWTSCDLLAIANLMREVIGRAALLRPMRAVAQLGRAPRSGRGGRGFKSHQPDYMSEVKA